MDYAYTHGRPISEFIKNGDIGAVKYLIDKVDISVPSYSGKTPLMVAAFAEENAVEIVNLLLDAGADAYKSVDDRNLFEAVILYNRHEITATLLDRKIEFKDSEGLKLYPLHYAARCNAKETVIMLLERGFDINGTDDFGATALHASCRLLAIKNKTEMIAWLLQAGADPYIKDNNGNMPGTYMYPPHNFGDHARCYEEIMRNNIANTVLEQCDDAEPSARRSSRRSL